jgi:hypothetical protein
MAHHDHHAPAAPVPEKFDKRHAGVLPLAFLAAGGIGLLGALIGLLVPGWREQFAFSWLFAFTYFFTLAVGSLFWVCLHHATDAEWSTVIRRQLENVASLIPYLALFFLPLLICIMSKNASGEGLLLKWWFKAPGEDPLLDAKQPYLSHGFFYLRIIFYFLMLGWIAWSLRSRSTRQDGDGSARHTFVMRKFGIGGIPALAVCLTFISIDLLMGLDYHWFSTMWGVYIFAGAAGASMSLCVIIVTALRDKGYLKPVTTEHYHIMGKFMLAFTVFWAYIGYSQYMLIWYANVPEETIYFRIRNTESWNILSTALVVGRFFLPFPVLLLQWTKKNPQHLVKVAYWILAMQFLDLYIVVLPALHPTGFSPSLLDLLSFVGIGGILGWLFLHKLGRAHTFPLRDPRLGASIHLTN